MDTLGCYNKLGGYGQASWLDPGLLQWVAQPTTIQQVVDVGKTQHLAS